MEQRFSYQQSRENPRAAQLAAERDGNLLKSSQPVSSASDGKLDAVVGTKLLAGELRFGSKRDVAAMLQMSIRSVDNYVARGCPHIALSKRRLRFDLTEVRAWFKQQYGQQRRAAPKVENGVA
jgi:hypothetical protein